MAISVEGSNASATVIARAEQQSRQQDEAQRANRERLVADAARTRQVEQQSKEVQKPPPAPVANEKGQSTGSNVNTTA